MTRVAATLRVIARDRRIPDTVRQSFFASIVFVAPEALTVDVISLELRRAYLKWQREPPRFSDLKTIPEEAHEPFALPRPADEMASNVHNVPPEAPAGTDHGYTDEETLAEDRHAAAPPRDPSPQ